MAKKKTVYYPPEGPQRPGDYRRYDPAGMFETPSEEMRERHYLPSPGLTGGVNLDLAEAFSQQRFNEPQPVVLGWYRAMVNNTNRYTNSGAAQLFNRETNTPVSRAFGNTSHPLVVGDERTTLGHSERFNMRDVLDDYMKKPLNSMRGKLEHPSYYVKSSDNRNHELEILQALVENAPAYKAYLEGKNPKHQELIVKEWSQRKRCENGEVPGGSCVNFTHSIHPRGSLYGYIYPDDEYGQNLEFDKWRLAYEQYHKEKNKPKRTYIPMKSAAASSGTSRAVGHDRADSDDDHPTKFQRTHSPLNRREPLPGSSPLDMNPRFILKSPPRG